MNKFSALPTMLIVLAVSGCMFNEKPQNDAAAAGEAQAASSVEKPGAPLDYLLDAHNSYLEEAHRPGTLRARRSAECTETALVQWGPIELAEKQ
jgi:hypothetical protein